jgi:hypothetical protein
VVGKEDRVKLLRRFRSFVGELVIVVLLFAVFDVLLSFERGSERESSRIALELAASVGNQCARLSSRRNMDCRVRVLKLVMWSSGMVVSITGILSVDVASGVVYKRRGHTEEKRKSQ